MESITVVVTFWLIINKGIEFLDRKNVGNRVGIPGKKNNICKDENGSCQYYYYSDDNSIICKKSVKTFLVTPLLRCNSHMRQFTCLMCTIQWFLLYSVLCKHHHN